VSDFITFVKKLILKLMNLKNS